MNTLVNTILNAVQAAFWFCVLIVMCMIAIVFLVVILALLIPTFFIALPISIIFGRGTTRHG